MTGDRRYSALVSETISIVGYLLSQFRLSRKTLISLKTYWEYYPIAYFKLTGTLLLSAYNKAAYMVIGIDLDGIKDVLGIWIGENESAKFWLNVLNELKNRGVQDILITCVDNLTGFSDAIAACYPDAEIQKCIVHQIRNSIRYVSYKDVKKITAALKPIYTASSEAAEELNQFEAAWEDKYPLIVRSWRNNWAEISTFFKYPPEIRKIIYTTNIIESYYRQLRKVTKGKSIFPTDEALLKMLYLSTQDVLRKWIGRVQNWGQILLQLSIYFPIKLTPIYGEHNGRRAKHKTIYRPLKCQLYFNNFPAL